MKTTDKKGSDPVPSKPNHASPLGVPERSKNEESSEDDDDPLFDEEEESFENFEEDDDESTYEINDKFAKADLKDIFDYMSSSL